ncbi:MAG: FAD-dependent monooxygenase [Kosmotogaceae bacterium]
MQHHDVIVVGAGPAGIAASKVLSTHGLEVLLLDKSSFPHNKSCGGYLTPRSIKLLSKIFPDFDYPKKKINIVEFGHFKNDSFKPLQRVLIKSDFHTVNRKDFDNLLLAEAKKYGVKLSTERVKSITVEDNLFIIEGNEKYSAEYVIVASGVFGPKLLKIPDTLFEVPRFSISYHSVKESNDNIIKIGYLNNAYYWSFPKPQKTFIGVGFYKNIMPDNLQIAQKLLGKTNVNFKGTTIPFFEPEKSFKNNNTFDGCLFAGDSAGFVDNWTGEGISFALKSGTEAAKAIIKRYSRPNKVNDQYLYNIRIMARHLILAESFRKTFNRNIPANLDLLKEKRLLKLFISYISTFSKSANSLFLKSLFVRTPKIII